MSKFRNLSQNTRDTLVKTFSYYIMHILVASGVAYLITGSLLTAITLSLLEPTVQAIAYFFHEKAWQRRAERRKSRELESTASLEESRIGA